MTHEGKEMKVMSGIHAYINRLSCLSTSKNVRVMKFVGRKLLRAQSGSSMVEMALCTLVLATVLIGVIEFSFAFYTYNLVSEAAREATRYASIRGYNSCLYATTTFPDCNLGPDSTGSTASASTALQNYLKSRSFPYAGSLQVAANWYSPTGGVPNKWNMSCAASSDPNTTSPLYGDACNFPGHAVQVQVTLAYPLTIPFVPSQTINMTSTSEMVISE